MRSYFLYVPLVTANLMIVTYQLYCLYIVPPPWFVYEPCDMMLYYFQPMDR